MDWFDGVEPKKWMQLLYRRTPNHPPDIHIDFIEHTQLVHIVHTTKLILICIGLNLAKEADQQNNAAIDWINLKP